MDVKKLASERQKHCTCAEGAGEHDWELDGDAWKAVCVVYWLAVVFVPQYLCVVPRAVVLLRSLLHNRATAHRAGTPSLGDE